jgi:hypothetical protein
MAYVYDEIRELIFQREQLGGVVMHHMLVPVAVEIFEKQNRGDQSSYHPIAFLRLEDGAMRTMMEDDDLKQTKTRTGHKQPGGKQHPGQKTVN